MIKAKKEAIRALHEISMGTLSGNTSFPIIFDLDGTLIDSSPSILSALGATLSFHDIRPAVQLEPSIIGPPLRDILAKLAGTADSVLLDAMGATFKAHYDTSGYISTAIFPGVSELLSELWRRGIPLFIATNKRLHPTHLILEHLGWIEWFRGVYALDCVVPHLLNKAVMLSYLLGDVGIDPAQAFYVGDKLEDGFAADENALPFIAACWGYGGLSESEMRSSWRASHRPADVLACCLDH